MYLYFVSDWCICVALIEATDPPPHRPGHDGHSRPGGEERAHRSGPHRHHPAGGEEAGG